MKLMTNNPAKYSGLKGYGLSIAGRVPLLTPITSENRKYMETKRTKMGHVYGVMDRLTKQMTATAQERSTKPTRQWHQTTIGIPAGDMVMPYSSLVEFAK